MSSTSPFMDAPLFPSNASLPQPGCFFLGRTVLILTAFCVTNILLVLPLSVLVLCLGFRRWRRRRSSTAAMSHSDAFAYHMAAMELIGLLGGVLYCAGLLTYGFYMFFSTWSVKIHFHTLTCVERYLAVVHPVTYLGLKASGGVRVRNLSIACLWLLSLVWLLLVKRSDSTSKVVFFLLAILAFAVTCFCCVSVLCALRRRGPGEAGGDRRRADQTRQRAFGTVATVMAVLWLCVGGMLVCNALAESHTLSDGDVCAVRAAAIWFSLPSSLVLPLLYLHRAGKLPGCGQ